MSLTRSPQWLTRLYHGLTRARHPQQITVTVNAAQDDRLAVALAGKLPGLIEALRDPDALADVPSADLSMLLRQLNYCRQLLDVAADNLIVTWHDRNLERGSWRTIGDALDLHHTTVSEQYPRMLHAHTRGWELTAEERHGSDAVVRLCPEGTGWRLSVGDHVLTWYGAQALPLDELLIDAARNVEQRYGRPVVTWNPRPAEPGNTDRRSTYTAVLGPVKADR